MFARLTLLALLVSACGVSTLDVGDGDEAFGASSTFALSVSTADTTELLAFVNHPATTGERLDVEVGLDARAARGIIAHRDGADGVPGTADDDLFSSLPELDLVPYVGDSALSKLLAFALAHPVALPETVEGVAFTAEEVSAVVWGVNQTSSDELDGAMQFDSRTANNLLNDTPYATIAQMGAVPYVGPAALTKLRDNAPVWAAKRAGTVTLAGTFDGVAFDEPTAQEALGLANERTYAELVAGGLPATGAAPLVGNRPYTSLVQVAAVSGVGPATMKALHAMAQAPAVVTPSVPDGGECDASQRLCLRGLVCTGLSYLESGWCRPEWMASRFSSGTVAQIPDASPAGVSMGLVVSGLASVPEDVIVHLDIDHPRKSDLRVILTQPSSAEAVVWPVGSDGDARVVMGGGSGVERDSSVNGEWFITIVDTVSGQSGQLLGWSLELTSRYD